MMLLLREKSNLLLGSLIDLPDQVGVGDVSQVYVTVVDEG